MANETIEARLEKLPLRSIVAFAARCARRAQQLFAQSRTTHGLHDPKARVERAIAIAESFALGTLVSPSDADAAADVAAAGFAFTAAAAARAAARAAATDDATDTARVADTVRVVAGFAADTTKVAVGSRIVDFAALGDLEKLESLAAGKSEIVGESLVGDPIDPSESGPMGLLWPNGLPGISAIRSNRDVLTGSYSGSTFSTENIHPPLNVYIDLGAADIESIRDLFLILSSLYESYGGSGLRIVSHEQRTQIGVELPV